MGFYAVNLVRLGYVTVSMDYRLSEEAPYPATLLLHGTIDTIVPIIQAEKLAKKLAANDVPYIYAPFKGGYHGYDFFKDANPGVMYLIEEFLAEYLAK